MASVTKIVQLVCGEDEFFETVAVDTLAGTPKVGHRLSGPGSDWRVDVAGPLPAPTANAARAPEPKTKRADVSWAELGDCTTLMVKSIPPKVTQSELLQEINALGFAGYYDFCYLPKDSKRRTNRCIAFINFATADIAKEFARRAHGRTLDHPDSKEPLEILPAVVQGFENNVARHTEALQGGPESNKPFVLWQFPDHRAGPIDGLVGSLGPGDFHSAGKGKETALTAPLSAVAAPSYGSRFLGDHFAAGGGNQIALTEPPPAVAAPSYGSRFLGDHFAAAKGKETALTAPPSAVAAPSYGSCFGGDHFAAGGGNQIALTAPPSAVAAPSYGSCFGGDHSATGRGNRIAPSCGSRCFVNLTASGVGAVTAPTYKQDVLPWGTKRTYMVNFCPHCGLERPSGAQHCQSCGCPFVI